MTAPRWTEVRVAVPLGWQELVAQAFAAAPFTCVAFGSTSIAEDAPPPGCDYVRTFVQSGALARPPGDEVRERLDELARCAQVAELTGLEPRVKELPPEDYAQSWRKSWKPFRVGRLCVLLPWMEGEPRPGDVRLSVEPGGAFGSGRHATTRACLRVLQERLAGGERVLDAGSGSGILAVAAVLLGARHALAFDVDPHAKPYGDDLAERNGVARAVEYRSGGFAVLRETDRVFDAVMANIYSDVLQENARDLRERMRAGAWFVFSGVSVHHAEPTRRAIESAGLEIEEERRRGRWHTFVGRR